MNRFIFDFVQIIFKVHNKRTTQLAKEENILRSKKIYTRQISIQKDVPHAISSRKFKYNKQWDPTTHLIEWRKSGTLKTPNADKDKQQHICNKDIFNAGGDEKWYSHFGRHFVSFFQNCSLIFTQISWKLMSTWKPAHRCLSQLYS